MHSSAMQILRRSGTFIPTRIASTASSRKLIERVYTAIFEKNMRNSTVNYLIPDWLTAVT